MMQRCKDQGKRFLFLWVRGQQWPLTDSTKPGDDEKNELPEKPDHSTDECEHHDEFTDAQQRSTPQGQDWAFVIRGWGFRVENAATLRVAMHARSRRGGEMGQIVLTGQTLHQSR